MSDGETDIWPVFLSEIVGDTLSDLDVLPALFSVVVALTVVVCENPWLEGSNSLEDDPDWREILIPGGHGIAAEPAASSVGRPSCAYPHSSPVLPVAAFCLIMAP
ncbi:MAG: hypothetical protein ACRDRX_15335 [Pseudonocardiaceae bacterium]